jgi:DNA-directed RNA polymerase specialized sigma24 family protein
MSSDDTIGSISICLEMLKRGERAGAQRLWEAYFHRLVRLARDRIAQSHPAGADEEDVALSVMKSFMLRAERGRFPRLEDRDDLWHILYIITIRKSVDLIRRNRAHLPPGGRLVSLSDLADLESAGAIDTAPTPDVALQLAEQARSLIDSLGDQTLRDIAIWKMEGYTNKVIAGRLGVIEKTVERKLQRIRNAWRGEAKT